jgi:IS5 family transposase
MRSPIRGRRRRFGTDCRCGLPLEVGTPDYSSIWRFRQTIDQVGISAVLLAGTNRQLDALGLNVKRGTLVDATLIAASVKRPPYRGGGVSPLDREASRWRQTFR